MIKRMTLVWKRPELSDRAFRDRWLGEHVRYARQLKDLRGYIIDFVTDGAGEGPHGIATLRFDTPEALAAAFADLALKGNLERTREEFAANVKVLIVDEEVVLP